MRQTDVIFAGVAIAFLIYITVRGQLGSYASLLVGQPGQSTATKASASSSSSSTGPNATSSGTELDIMDLATTAAMAF